MLATPIHHSKTCQIREMIIWMVSPNLEVPVRFLQCCGAGAAWSRSHFFVGRSRCSVYGPRAGAAWGRLEPTQFNEPESSPGPRTSGAGATKKNWRLCNTDLKCVNYCKTKTKYSVCITAYKKITFFKTPFVIYNSTIIISVLWELFKAYFL